MAAGLTLERNSFQRSKQCAKKSCRFRICGRCCGAWLPLKRLFSWRCVALAGVWGKRAWLDNFCAAACVIGSSQCWGWLATHLHTLNSLHLRKPCLQCTPAYLIMKKPCPKHHLRTHESLAHAATHLRTQACCYIEIGWLTKGLL